MAEGGCVKGHRGRTNDMTVKGYASAKSFCKSALSKTASNVHLAAEGPLICPAGLHGWVHPGSSDTHGRAQQAVQLEEVRRSAAVRVHVLDPKLVQELVLELLLLHPDHRLKQVSHVPEGQRSEHICAHRRVCKCGDELLGT